MDPQRYDGKAPQFESYLPNFYQRPDAARFGRIMKFFVLRNPKAGGALAVTDFLPVERSRRGRAPQCPVCGKYVGVRPLLPPVRVELKAWGVLQWGDVAFGTGDQILVATKLTTLFSRAGLVGWARLDPVEVVKTTRRRAISGPPPAY